MTPKPTSSKNAARRLIAFSAWLLEQDAPAYYEMFDEFLDSILNEDGFGTEGQCDPRGDRRG